MKAIAGMGAALLVGAVLVGCASGQATPTAPPTPAFSASQLQSIVQSGMPDGESIALPCTAAQQQGNVYRLDCQQEESFFVNVTILQWSAANERTATWVNNLRYEACLLHGCQ